MTVNIGKSNLLNFYYQSDLTFLIVVPTQVKSRNDQEEAQLARAV